MTKKHIRNKNRNEQINYDNYYIKSIDSLEETINYNNPNLKGSDELLSDDEESNLKKHKVKDYSLPKKIKRFFSKHIVTTVVGVLIIPFITWTVRSIHNNDIKIAKIETKIEYIENNIEKLNDNDVNKVYFKEYISEIKNDLRDNQKKDINEIIIRLNDIEKQLNIKD